LALAFLAFQVFEGLVLQPFVERRTIRLGPFLTVAGGFAGLELYGIGGAIMTLLGLSVLVAAADEIAPD
jgi:predicted PurR-regulated permease PerM